MSLDPIFKDSTIDLMTPITYEIVLHVLTILTIIFQLYVFFLVRRHSPKSMQEYKFFLNYFTFWDLKFTVLLGAVLQPDPVGRLLSARARGFVANMNPEVQLITVALVFYAGSNVILSQNFCLMYRYSAIRESKRLHRMFTTSCAKFMCFLFGQVLSIIMAFFIYNTFIRPEKLTVENFDGQQLTDFRDYVEPGEFVLWTDLTSKITRGFMATTLVLFLLSEIVSIYMIYSILSTLRKNTSTFSKNTYKLHIQLTLLLAIQLLTPLLLIIIPVSIRLIKALFASTGSANATQFGFIFITFYGLSNSVFTVVFVTPYRNHFYNNFIYPWLKVVFSLLRIKNLAPRRKSVTWVSSTQLQNRRMTLVKNSLFVSD